MSRDRFEAISQTAIDTALPNLIVAKWNADNTKTKTVDVSAWKPSIANVVTRLIRREHAALVRAVKRLSTTHPAGLSIEDVLALLAKQKGRTRCD